MSKEIRGNQRHMTLENRIYIEKCLDMNMAFKDTAKFLCKDPTTISKEVKKHRQHKPRCIFILSFATFPVILTDNGSEFLNPMLLETGIESLIRTRIFYCDPNASYQKGALEKNHEFIRYLVPKGNTFDCYSQDDITLMINHINSTARASLNGRTPFELASLLLDKVVLETLGLKKIDHDDVNLKPGLLKK